MSLSRFHSRHAPDKRPRHSKPPADSTRLGVEMLEDRTLLATQIVTIGDSWASFIANGAPGTIVDPNLIPNSNVFQQVLNNHSSGAQVYNGGFYGGLAAGHATQLGQITNIINAAGPDVDIVYLSSGGNDFLAGIAGGWYQQKPANEVQSLFDAVGANVQTVVNHILSIRPDIQIVIASYDYINMWDFDPTSGGDNVRTVLGLIRTGNPGADALQNAAMNSALRDLETRKANIAAGNSRVHHVNLFGHLHSLYGYQGYLSNNINLPPGVWSDFPVQPYLLGSGGDDPIHLSDTGYYAFVDAVFNQFLSSALANGSLSLNTSSLNFGNIRAGTSSGTLSVTASNAGASFTKVENLLFGAASGSFAGGGNAANPLFRDPTLGSDSAAAFYSFSPTSRGSANQNVSITSGAGNASLTLSGQGVGPVYSAASSLNFLPVFAGTSATRTLAVSNVTTDGNLGPLTDLTITGASFTGPDASLFQLEGFIPGTTISAGALHNLAVRFNGAPANGTYTATLHLATDQGAPLGGMGQSFSVNLSVDVTTTAAVLLAADPDSPGLTSLLWFGTTGDDTVHFEQLDATTIRVILTKQNGVVVNVSSEFTGVSGRVIADAGSGNDVLDASALSSIRAKLLGGSGLDSLRGGGAADEVLGGTEDDSIAGGSGADWIDGGDGADVIFGDHEIASGQSLQDEYLGPDTIHGGIGNDTIYGDGDGGEGSADLIHGDDGNDTVYGDGAEGDIAFGTDTIHGGSGDDTIRGDADGAEGSEDFLYGDAGNDLIDTGGGNDFADGGADHDVVLGGDGAEGSDDTLVGGEGRDVLVGDGGVLNPRSTSGGADSLMGGLGDDVLIASYLAPIDAGFVLAIRDEWTSPRTYLMRVSNISGTGTGPRLNLNYFLQLGVTVQNDTPVAPATAVDVVMGGADKDWFFYELEDSLTDHQSGEQAFSGSPIFP